MVPHRQKPWSAKKMEERFPQLKEALDGQSPDAMLTFFYKFNKVENVFEFIDADAEEDFADLLGVKVLCAAIEEEAPPSEFLSPEQLQKHKENIAMIREGLEFFQQKE